jgi:hypothetical protein
MAGAVATAGGDEAGRGSGTTSPPTVSASRQFVVYADNVRDASTVSAYAERIKRRWRAALNQPDNWRDPLVLVLRSHDVPVRITVRVFATDLHLKYQIDCGLPQLDEPALRVALVGTLCAELANRDLVVRGPGTYETAPIPLWLAEGLAAEFGERTEDLLGAVRRDIPVAPPPTADGLLRCAALPEDLPARRRFQAEAWVFTTSLLALPRGPVKLQRFLRELAGQKSGVNAFWAVYQGDFRDGVMLEKWWAVVLMEWMVSQPPQCLTPQETEEQLAQILKVTIRERADDPTRVVGKRLADLGEYAAAPWLPQLANERALKLDVLSTRAHPFYRDALRIYRQALELLIQEQPEAFRLLIQQAELYQVLAKQRVAATSLYLDQFDQ